MTRRARLIAVVAVVIAGAVGVISSTQTWLVASIADAAGNELPVPGAAAVPVLAPLSLAVLALGLALSIVGVVLRIVLAALAAAAGVVLAALTAQVVFARPVTSVASTVTAATGISGVDAVGGIVSGIAATPWPVITLVGWAVLVAAGLYALATARRWRSTGRRFRTEASAEAEPATKTPEAIDAWDGLSRGEDPTAGNTPG